MPFPTYSATLYCGWLPFLLCRCIYWYFTNFEQNPSSLAAKL